MVFPAAAARTYMYAAVQDLDKTHLILWTDNPENITTDYTRVSTATAVLL